MKAMKNERMRRVVCNNHFCYIKLIHIYTFKEFIFSSQFKVNVWTVCSEIILIVFNHQVQSKFYHKFIIKTQKKGASLLCTIVVSISTLFAVSVEGMTTR